jgi:hypothetical protein
MNDSQVKKWTWVTRALQVAMAVAGVLAVTKTLPAAVQHWAALSVAMLGVCTAQIKGWMPASKPKAPPSVVFVIAAGLMLAAGCKVPPLATAYRSHALLVTARDGTGEALAKVQRAKMVKCEADYMPPHTPETKGKLIACYRSVKAPVDAWVVHIRPAITAAASALWLALEIAYVAGDSTLSKTKAAGAAACSALKAAEATLKQYADKLGELKTVVLGAIAGGKVLVCGNS